MKLTTKVAAAALAAANAWAGQAGSGGQQAVVVYLRGEILVPTDICVHGETVAARMFSEIGVRLEWRHRWLAAGQAQREQAMVINIVRAIPTHAGQNALGTARLYEGSAITIFYQSLKWAEQRPRLAPMLFAHVLAHEIAHNLQQVDRHSKTGIMKAQWTPKDLETMTDTPLRFEPEDVQWIYLGLAERAARDARDANTAAAK
jgi:hypothetical protein